MNNRCPIIITAQSCYSVHFRLIAELLVRRVSSKEKHFVFDTHVLQETFCQYITKTAKLCHSIIVLFSL